MLHWTWRKIPQIMHTLDAGSKRADKTRTRINLVTFASHRRPGQLQLLAETFGFQTRFFKKSERKNRKLSSLCTSVKERSKNEHRTSESKYITFRANFDSPCHYIRERTKRTFHIISLHWTICAQSSGIATITSWHHQHQRAAREKFFFFPLNSIRTDSRKSEFRTKTQLARSRWR